TGVNQIATARDPSGIAFSPAGATTVLPAELRHPTVLALTGIAPNPSRGAFRLDFELASHGLAKLEIFDLEGRRVRTLFAAMADPGAASVEWDGRGAGGHALSAGTYFARLSSGGGTV